MILIKYDTFLYIFISVYFHCHQITIFLINKTDLTMFLFLDSPTATYDPSAAPDRLRSKFTMPVSSSNFQVKTRWQSPSISVQVSGNRKQPKLVPQSPRVDAICSCPSVSTIRRSSTAVLLKGSILISAYKLDIRLVSCFN